MRKKHNMSDTRLYGVWKGMKQRCNDPNCKEYSYYGKRGISVCDEWMHDFMEFYKWAINNGYDETAKRGTYTLDRKDTNGNYCPENCRWITIKEQENNRRDNHIIEYDGVKYTLAQAEKEFDIPQTALRRRLSRGMSIKDAIEKPIHQTATYMYCGKPYTALELSEISGINVKTIRARIRYGWPIERVVSEPINR